MVRTHLLIIIITTPTNYQVTLFSDPMVDALSRLVNKENHNYYYTKDDGHTVRGQYIPIPGTLTNNHNI